VRSLTLKGKAMGRNPDPNRKRELVEESIPYVLTNGVATLSLRPLAAHLDTSARNLLYHFGTSSRLLQLIMDELKTQELESLAEVIGDAKDTSEASHIIETHVKRYKDTFKAYVEYALSVPFDTLHRRKYLQEIVNVWTETLSMKLPRSVSESGFVEAEIRAVFGEILLSLALTEDTAQNL